MSAHRPAIQLTDQAEHDIEEILLYTERRWDFDQREIYAEAINQAIILLRDHPELGRRHEGLFHGCRSVRVEQHIIYFHLPRPNLIEIVRVLHARQDSTSNITAPDD
jgi:toxin ParE1/3/4